MTITTGEELPDGRISDQNYVWLSQWQLENLNSNDVLPIDLEHYRQLTTPIAKAMVPLLYQWFYAASRRPVQKRYRELCQLLNISMHTAISKAAEKLGPALNQLKNIGYLESWELVRTVDHTDFKLVIAPGHIFQKQMDAPVPHGDVVIPTEFGQVVRALVERNVEEKVARRLLLDVPDDYDALATIEWVDQIVSRSRNITNPPGLYVSFLRDGLRPPAGFLTSRRIEELNRTVNVRRTEEATRSALEVLYTEYKDQQITAHIENLGPDLKAKLFRHLDLNVKDQYPFLTTEQRNELVLRMAIKEVEPEVDLITFQEFTSRQSGQLSLA